MDRCIFWQDGRAPLHYAAAAGNAKIVKMLLEQNADVDLLATGPATAAHKVKSQNLALGSAKGLHATGSLFDESLGEWPARGAGNRMT